MPNEYEVREPDIQGFKGETDWKLSLIVIGGVIALVLLYTAAVHAVVGI